MQLMPMLTKKNMLKVQSAWGRYDNCHGLFLNKVEKFKSSCLISVAIKVLYIKTPTTVTFSIRHNFSITVKHIITFILQHCLLHTLGTQVMNRMQVLLVFHLDFYNSH